MFIKAPPESSMDLKQIDDNEHRHKALGIIFEVVLSLALSTGCWFTFFSMFPNPVNQAFSISFIVIIPVISYFLTRLPGPGRYMIFYVFIAVALYLVIFYKSVWNGLLVYVNIIIEMLNEQLSLGLVGYETVGGGAILINDAFLVFVPAIVIVSISIAYSVFYKEVILGLSLTSLPIAVGLCLKAVPSVWLLALLLISWTGLLVLSAVAQPISKKKNRPIYIQNEKQSSLPVIFLTVVLILLLVLILCFSDDSYNPPKSVDAIKAKVVEVEEHFRYDKIGGDTIDGLSKGDLSKTHSLEYTDNGVMTVRMDLAQSMYLRGFTGGFYDKDKWISSEDQAFSGEYKGIIQWLNAEGFYPWCQLDSLYRLSNDYDLVNVDVENINGNSKYTYIPYETAMAGDITPEKVDFHRDSELLSRGILGDREYSFTAFVPEYEGYDSSTSENWLSRIRKNPGYDEYLNLESVYRRFVYDTYLYISNETMGSLGGIQTTMEEDIGLDPDSVIFSVRSKLESDYTYDISTESAPDGKGELEYFVNSSKLGNDMHFATLATLMFRSAGVPARYAEGYYISPTQIELYTAFDSDIRIDVLDSYAHSWVEIYVDEIGWTPVEVIPGFYDLEKKETEEEEVEEEIKKEDESFKRRKEPIEDVPEEDETEKNPVSPWWLILIAFVILILMYELLGRYRMNKLRSAFGTVFTDKQGYDMYRYVCRVLKFDSIKLPKNAYDKVDEVSETYDGATDMNFYDFLEIINGMRFGEKILGESEHKEMATYVKELNSSVYNRQGRLRKFLMRFVFFYV